MKNSDSASRGIAARQTGNAAPPGPHPEADDEVAFWRGFIDWWQAKEGRPATARMRDALAYAEAKQQARMETAADAGVSGRGKDARHRH